MPIDTVLATEREFNGNEAGKIESKSATPVTLGEQWTTSYFKYLAEYYRFFKSSDSAWVITGQRRREPERLQVQDQKFRRPLSSGNPSMASSVCKILSIEF